MGLLDMLGIGGRGTAGHAPAPAGPLTRIARRLQHLPPERARRIAALAFVLARAANADLEISEEERRRIGELLERLPELEAGDAELVAELATHQNELSGSTHDYLVTRELRQSASREERLRLLALLFQVAAADRTVTLVEEEEIRRISDELGLEHRDYIEARTAIREHRSVLRGGE